ncbi:MAG: thrombospondin type 3 repeat-containing protein [Kiritimatiellia bacterium]
MARALYEEIEFRVPNGPSPALSSHLSDLLAATNHYAVINLGQLKHVFALLSPAALLVAPAMAEDSDDDGLTNAEEMALGTNTDVQDKVVFGFGVTPVSLRGKGVSAYYANLGERLNQHAYPGAWDVDNRYWYLSDNSPVPILFHSEPQLPDGYECPGTQHPWFDAIYFAYPNDCTQPYEDEGHSYAFVRKNRNAVSVVNGEASAVYVTRFVETFRSEQEIMNPTGQFGEMRRWVTFYTKTGSNPGVEVFSNEHELPVPLAKGKATLLAMPAAFNLIGSTRPGAGVLPSQKVNPGGYGSVDESYLFSIPGAYGGDHGEVQFHLVVEGPPGSSPEVWTHDGNVKIAQLDLSQPLNIATLQSQWLALVSNQKGTYKLKLTATFNGDSTVLQDVCKITLLRATFAGPRVYDPRLAAGQPAAVNFKIEGPAGSAPPVELAVLNMAEEEVACLVQKTESPPSYGIQVQKTWDGRYGDKGDGNPTVWKGKYASPGTYKVRLRLWPPASPDHPVYSTDCQVNLVRLGVTEIGFLGDQKLVYHKTEPDKLGNYPFASATQFEPASFNDDVVWKIEHLDFVKSEGLSRVEARVGQKPEGESYLDTDNLYGRGEAEWYFDADGSGNFSPGLRQVNFPPLRPTSAIAVATGVETDRFNRPVVVVEGMPLEVWFKLGGMACSDLQPEARGNRRMESSLLSAH